MELRQLEAFVAVATELHFGRVGAPSPITSAMASNILGRSRLDYADYLIRLGEAEAATAEARSIAGRLCCQPLLDRAADLSR